MNRKRFFVAAMTAVSIFSMPLATYAENSATEKLIQIEEDTYGAEQVGAILNRISKIEKDYSGKNMQGNMNARIDAAYDNLYSNFGEPSIISKVNALEWNVNREVQSGGIDKRLAALENEILGKAGTGNFSARIRELSKASFGGENVPLVEVQVPANTAVKVSLIDSITSKTLQVGDVVKIKVAEDVIIGGKLVFAKGLQGVGKVASVRKAKGWMGKNGKVDIDFDELRTIDGRSIETFVGEEAKQKMIDEQMIEGASLVAMNLNDDWNKVLVRGKNIEIKQGTELYIQAKNNSSVYALSTENGSLRLSSTLTTQEIHETKNSEPEEVISGEDDFYLDDEE